MSKLTADPLDNVSFDSSLAVLEQKGLYLAPGKASIKVEEVYQEEVHHLLEEQPFALFCSFWGKVLASAAGNFFAKRKLKTSPFLPPLPKALENNFKEEHPPSTLRVQNIPL